MARRIPFHIQDIRKGFACGAGMKWEFLLEKVCRFLGRPGLCPYRKLVSGEGLQGLKATGESMPGVDQAICPFHDLEVKDRGTIVCLATDDRGRLYKLMAMGVLPGLRITLNQKFPSYVFQIGQSQFAIDRQIAEGIYVRREGDPEGAPKNEVNPGFPGKR